MTIAKMPSGEIKLYGVNDSRIAAIKPVLADKCYFYQQS